MVRFTEFKPAEVLYYVHEIIAKLAGGEGIGLGNNPQIKMARKLLKVRIRPENRWSLPSEDELAYRLKWCGLSRDGREVADTERWALAWQQLVMDAGERPWANLDVSVLNRRIERGDTAPAPTTYRKPWACAEPPAKEKTRAWRIDNDEEDSLQDRDDNPYMRVMRSRIRRKLSSEPPATRRYRR